MFLQRYNFFFLRDVPGAVSVLSTVCLNAFQLWVDSPFLMLIAWNQCIDTGEVAYFVFVVLFRSVVSFLHVFFTHFSLVLVKHFLTFVCKFLFRNWYVAHQKTILKLQFRYDICMLAEFYVVLCSQYVVRCKSEYQFSINMCYTCFRITHLQSTQWKAVRVLCFGHFHRTSNQSSNYSS